MLDLLVYPSSLESIGRLLLLPLLFCVVYYLFLRDRVYFVLCGNFGVGVCFLLETVRCLSSHCILIEGSIANLKFTIIYRLYTGLIGDSDRYGMTCVSHQVLLVIESSPFGFGEKSTLG